MLGCSMVAGGDRGVAIGPQVRARPGWWRPVVAVWLLLLLVATPVLAYPQDVAAGQRATISGGGNPLYDAPDPSGGANVLTYVDHGVWVDVLYGPHKGMYQIRYYGIDGWIWSDKIALEGSGGGVGGSGGGGGGGGGAEHWIDVDRSSSTVTLYIGNQPQASYWGAMGKDQSDYGFYATAIGTYYITEKHRGLSYTPYAENYVTHWVEFDHSRDNGFHSFIKDEWGSIVPGGAGPTGGCVGMDEGPIAHVYDFSYIGMRVEIHW